MSKNDRPIPPTVLPDIILPTARGLSLCLDKLAEEAMDLGLRSTRSAIRHAMEVCHDEAMRAGGKEWTVPLN